MQTIEDDARRAGFRLLTLDAKRGAAAEQLYRHLGWTAVGTIPRYALDPDGHTLHDAVVFYKELNQGIAGPALYERLDQRSTQFLTRATT